MPMHHYPGADDDPPPAPAETAAPPRRRAGRGRAKNRRRKTTMTTPQQTPVATLQLGVSVFKMDWEKAAELEAHPLALLFPPLPEEDMDSLTSDLADNGQVHAVVLLDNKILDGVHRTKGCVRNRQSVKCVRFEDLSYQGTPSDFVYSENSVRRHMSLKQLAMVDAALLNYEKIRAEQAAAGKLGGKLGGRGHKKEEPSSANCTEGFVAPQKPAPQNREKIAKRVGVSERTAQQAIDVAKHAPELAPKVIQGAVPFDEAAAEAKKRAAAKRPPTKPAASKPKPMTPQPTSQPNATEAKVVRIEDLIWCLEDMAAEFMAQEEKGNDRLAVGRLISELLHPAAFWPIHWNREAES